MTTVVLGTKDQDEEEDGTKKSSNLSESVGLITSVSPLDVHAVVDVGVISPGNT